MVCPDLDFDFVLFFFFSGTSADLSLVVAVGGDALRLGLKKSVIVVSLLGVRFVG